MQATWHSVWGCGLFGDHSNVSAAPNHLWLVHNGSQLLNEVVSCLVHGHLRKAVAVVIAAGLISCGRQQY